ncbi:PREDICTED: transmembrane protein 53-B isoform X2 [Rhagoletis zephyria]|uniref:transmembrane protein 53-B isoform X2 n=2 Tax=Rhagoletis zephyria TaxID=28612 RepID=UPI000811A39E|nr:PREDICTED: transmembrane protein 53-B isoform X2 [Rhagoletis zephyria]
MYKICVIPIAVFVHSVFAYIMASSMYYASSTGRILRFLTTNINYLQYYKVNQSILVKTVFALSTRYSSSTAVVPVLPVSGISADSNKKIITSLIFNSGPGSILNRRNDAQQINCRHFSSLKNPLQFESTKIYQQMKKTFWNNRRMLSTKEITKNITLFTNEPFKSELDPKTLEFKKPSENPLVLMMAWLMAKQKHLKKYTQIYTDMGFDVVVVHVTPWQLLWPVKGTQVVAAETLKFIENNKSYAPIVIHGFSVGAYQLGEVMIQMARDMERYTQVLDRIVCQIWDSAADITEIPIGVPKSIFPKNSRMQSALRNYILYHMKTFHNQASVHYMRSSQMFHSTLIKQPALFFVSENDPIGPPSSNQAVRENWERANIKVTFKCWERSQHAAHLIRHREEYLECLVKHLESCGLTDNIGLKTRAKL